MALPEFCDPMRSTESAADASLALLMPRITVALDLFSIVQVRKGQNRHELEIKHYLAFSVRVCWICKASQIVPVSGSAGLASRLASMKLVRSVPLPPQNGIHGFLSGLNMLGCV
ncbi:unnamed protein product [Polarella glacialis]|uniref:Uncharacterized protein n=1 Tax=Polarella glacialis TaxID=89957 RepID=A0A813EQW7_POLGL|nr:unnamed protein product [Polarella glacialis]